jgi:hypothetical protein
VAQGSREAIDEACRLWMGGETVRQLSERWNMPAAKVRKMLGPVLGHHRDVVSLVQEDPEDDVKRIACEMWRTGAKSLEELGTLFGFPTASVLRWTEESGTYAEGSNRRGALIRDRLDSTVSLMLRQLEVTVIPMTKDAQKAAILLGVLVDKRQLIYDKPTAIGRVESGGDPAERVLGSIDRLTEMLGIMGGPTVEVKALPPAALEKADRLAGEMDGELADGWATATPLVAHEDF